MTKETTIIPKKPAVKTEALCLCTFTSDCLARDENKNKNLSPKLLHVSDFRASNVPSRNEEADLALGALQAKAAYWKN